MPTDTRGGSARQTMRSIAVDGQQLRVCVRPADGAAGGVPLLLVNGIGASLELLQPFVDKLSPSLEVIRFDVPGVGGSPPPALPYRFTGLCRLIAGLLTALDHGQAGGAAPHADPAPLPGQGLPEFGRPDPVRGIGAR